MSLPLVETTGNCVSGTLWHSSTMEVSILVLGLGELGCEVVKSLATHPASKRSRISVLLRPSNNAERREKQLDELQAWSVNVITGDITQDSEDQLTAIFKGFQTVICCTGMTASPNTQVKITKSVLKAGVDRYIPWQFGIDYDKIGRNSSQDLFDSQLDVRDLLRSQSQTDWVIVSTGMFIPFIFEPAFGIVNADRSVVTAIGSWDNELTVTAPEDIGRVVAEIVLECPGIQGVIQVSGDTVTMKDIANIVDQVTGVQVTRQLKTVSDLKAELAANPSDGMRKYSVVFAEGVGVAWSKSSSFNERRSMPMKTVEQWLMEQEGIQNPH